MKLLQVHVSGEVAAIEAFQLIDARTRILGQHEMVDALFDAEHK